MSEDDPIQYIDRTRTYYQSLGYGEPYGWASFEDVPFAPLTKPLRESRVAIVTTAAPYQLGKGDQGPRAPYNAAAKFYKVYTGNTSALPDLRISHIAIDRDHTTAEDIGSYFPLAALHAAADEDRVYEVAPRFFGLPTNRSQNTTANSDCPELVRLCRADQVDVALLVPNCPVCHQSVAFAARALESAGISTVIMGCALDIVEQVGVPRFLFSDFPLGNSTGRPNGPGSQREMLTMALDLLGQAKKPRTTVRSSLRWYGEPDWKENYSNASRLSPEEIICRRAAFDTGRAVASGVRRTTKR